MIGHVDSDGRALIAISIRASDEAAVREVVAWIDTGFNGDLVLPFRVIDDLKLPQTGTIKAMLADGSEISLRRYVCLITWFGETRELEVVANDGEYPLLGIGLMLGHDLKVSDRDGSVSID